MSGRASRGTAEGEGGRFPHSLEIVRISLVLNPSGGCRRDQLKIALVLRRVAHPRLERCSTGGNGSGETRSDLGERGTERQIALVQLPPRAPVDASGLTWGLVHVRA